MLNAQSLLSTMKRKWRSDIGVDPITLPHGLVKLVLDVDLSSKQTQELGVYDASIKLFDFPTNCTLLWAEWTHSTALSVDSDEIFECDVNLDASPLLPFATAASTTWAPTDVSGKSLYMKTVFPITTYVNQSGFSANISLYMIVGAPVTHLDSGGINMYEVGDNTYTLAITCGANGALTWEYQDAPGGPDSGSLAASETTANPLTFDATRALVLTADPDPSYVVDAWTCSINGTDNGTEFIIGGAAQWGALLDFPTAIGTAVTISVSFTGA